MKEIKQKIYSQAMAVMLAFSLATTTLLTTIMPVHSYENSVAINAANFPDANFRTYVKKFDKNSDNTLSSTEINSVTSIYAPSRNIKNLV